ncbi:uncharacterized protein PFL1_04687 [Pseudozyma flocculosa PF-1]|uniref:Uncharacterized protein n=2 Tax=Pseudozyma flocculosa TaxID=84751 RepID=A0A5C3FEE3_9BASI|nr:uncharacterized protein PFL1_04687 [Pseudozyma flocculosa PF-1]EPQ27943.1 hypothetical protein PFL1_04687 [Pseudozyma flocculosa PF-1]SPO41729.1 uncharacterized protein PSFLO_07211 [Pseudozyma flocculosa]
MSSISNRSPTLLFSYPSTRLVKTVAPLPPPKRINGAVPADSIGAGTLAPTHAVLADCNGPLQITVVPDPFNESISTLVLSVGFDEQQWGAARRFVLPFRSFELGQDGAPLSRPNVAGFDSAARPIYQGLGAGLHGQHGGSFWFFEDIGEEGALDRQRWEENKVGRRAIWTVWLLGAPAPVVDYARDLLLHHPKPVPPLPPFLRDPAAMPWRDNYATLPLANSEAATFDIAQQPQQHQPDGNLEQSPTAAADVDVDVDVKLAGPRPLPPVPKKPEVLRSVSFPRRQPRSDGSAGTVDADAAAYTPVSPATEEAPMLHPVAEAASATPQVDQPEDPRPQPLRAISQESPLPHGHLTPNGQLDRYDRIRAETDELNAAVGEAPALQLPEPSTAPAEAQTRSEPQLDAAAATQDQSTAQPVPGTTLRNLSRHLPSRAPDYRHSLIAVDNETGQIVGVLASDVRLDQQSATPPLSPTRSDDAAQEKKDDERDELDELVTPVDEVDLGGGLREDLLDQGLQQKQEAEEDSRSESDQATPKPSAFIHRPTSLYRDPDHGRQPSRSESLLGDDTFAPPPPPPKAGGKPGDASPSARTSVASAAFFSANEGLEDDGDDDDEARARRAMMANFVSIGGGGDAHRIESHRPDLLRDLIRRNAHGEGDDDDDARSDVSGTTVGGPAFKMWRKVRGKPPKKKKHPQPAVDAPAGPTTARPPRVGSEASVRTSRAETAAESMSDDEDDEDDEEETASRGAEQDTEEDDDAAARDAETEGEDGKGGEEDSKRADSDGAAAAGDAAVEEARRLGHCSRAQLRTEDVRTIEDRVWREALESGDLPLDAPYTHLAARGGVGSTFLPSFVGKGADRAAPQEFELCAPGEVPVVRQGGKRAPAPYMQGGTVLIEFLAGSSRIGASLIGGPRPLALRGGDDADGPAADGVASSDKGGASAGVLSLVPLLPQHLLRFFGMSSAVAPSTAATSMSAAASSPPSSLAGSIPFLSDVASLWTDATGWMGGLFSSSSSSAANSTSSASAASSSSSSSMTGGNDGGALPQRHPHSEAEEWEYAIPDFDPNSLASTPRPVYRRKRPVPSATNGFSMPGQQQPSSSTSTSKRVEPMSSVTGGSGRYSILHIDGYGVGRQAFLRGMPQR